MSDTTTQTTTGKTSTRKPSAKKKAKTKAIEMPSTLAHFQTAEDSAVRVTVEEYRGVPKIDVRRFWKPEDADDFRHTKFGAAIRGEKDIIAFLDAVAKADPGIRAMLAAKKADESK